MTATDLPTCDTCRNWRSKMQPSGRVWGACATLDNPGFLLAKRHRDGLDRAQSFKAHHTFGCNLHRAI